MAGSLFRKKSIAVILKDAEEGAGDGHGGNSSLRKVLGVKDLTFLGIAAVIGTGVFTAIGTASYHGGPAVILLFLFTAVACGFAAYCYAEFASTVPVSGSAYTYSYVAFGEIFAWIIGWDLLMEYAIGNIAVAISWSQYFVQVLKGFGVYLPQWITMDYVTAHNGYKDAISSLAQHQSIGSLSDSVQNAYYAWMNAPTLGGLRLIMNIPALLIVVIITYVVYVGIKESRTANNIMVYTKLVIILLVIVGGAFYVHPVNWHPFMPNGFKGVMSGVSAVFFAYIGFDAISTTAEECKNAQNDLPKAMFNTLLICTGLYVVLVLVLTGMTNFSKLNVADPLAFVFKDQNSAISNIIAGVISVSAIIVIASVLLVYQLGQPRIWMSMSRDGLLPKVFSRIHPKYKTPSFSTIVTGFVVAVPALFLNLDVVIALTSIGTLFAFVLVCGGVLVLQNQKDKPESKFKVPYINGKYIVPIFLFAIFAWVYIKVPGYYSSLLTKEGVPMIIFFIVAIIVSIYTFIKNFSLIPVLGLLSCFYLMSQESHTNWWRFVIWLAIGLIIYFSYGIRKSKLAAK
ncbi:amino acid permease [Ferruginibacter albus]|uniref:amino acid permease n=1 Tax=Ferruginibacter albus TaxID=2875540 RepID=UPI001CC54377|nr:amino acid permease [Ferruginibacter albus]UAY53622.1 amino acid permease [Ferruginibacter albus]